MTTRMTRTMRTMTTRTMTTSRCVQAPASWECADGVSRGWGSPPTRRRDLATSGPASVVSRGRWECPLGLHARRVRSPWGAPGATHAQPRSRFPLARTPPGARRRRPSQGAPEKGPLGDNLRKRPHAGRPLSGRAPSPIPRWPRPRRGGSRPRGPRAPSILGRDQNTRRTHSRGRALERAVPVLEREARARVPFPQKRPTVPRV